MIPKAAWREEDILHAKATFERGMSKIQAAKIYNIPFTTFRNQLKNENMSRARLGSTPVFSEEQENEIAKK